MWGFFLLVAGTIVEPGPCVPTLTSLEVQFDEFTSNLDILMYYVAISNNTEANSTNCKRYVSQCYTKLSCWYCVKVAYDSQYLYLQTFKVRKLNLVPFIV